VNPLKASQSLFDIQAAGHITLPAELLNARAACDRVHPTSVDDAPHEVVAVEAAAQALVDGKRLDATPVAAARARLDQVDDERRVLALARTLADERFVATVKAHARAVITEHLDPAIKAVTDEAAPLLHKVGPLLFANQVTVMGASKADQAGALRLTKLVDAYVAIRGVHDQVRRHFAGLPTEDTEGLFGQISNAHEVVQVGQQPQAGKGVRTLPGRVEIPTTSTLAYLTWMVERGAKFWAPTAEQQDDAFLAAIRSPFNAHAEDAYRRQKAGASA
jgi:hypothetical protein